MATLGDFRRPLATIGDMLENGQFLPTPYCIHLNYFRNFVNMNRKRRGLVFMSALALLAAIGVLALWLGSSGNNDDIGRCLQVSHDQVIKMMND